jgi:TonB family protein
MYFDFEDYHPDITPVGRAISWREGVLLSIIAHLLLVIAILVIPRYYPGFFAVHPRPVAVEPEQTPQGEAPRFVFVQPRVDTPAPKPPPRAEPSDQDRMAQSPERAKEQTNPLPFSRGNTPERVEQAQVQPPQGQGPLPNPGQPEAPPASTDNNALQLPDSTLAQAQQQPPPKQPGLSRGPLGGGGLGDTLRNLQRYVQKDQFSNSGGGGAFGPAIQFDTMGVEFGPWIRRFIAQVKRNWEPLIPLAAMTAKGHVVMTFNVHKDGSITDLQVVGPSSVPPFNTAAYGALASSNPTAALPPEYPADKAFFTVTFFYNEDPQ